MYLSSIIMLGRLLAFTNSTLLYLFLLLIWGLGLSSMFILMLNFVKNQQPLISHNPFVFPHNSILQTQTLQLLVLYHIFPELVFDVSDHQKLREVRVQYILLLLVHNFVVPHDAILEMSEQQLTQSFQILQLHLLQIQVFSRQRLYPEVLDGLFLPANALHLIVLMQRIDAKPAGDGCWVSIQVVDKKRTAHRQYLYDHQSFHAMQLLSHSFLEGLLFFGKFRILESFFSFQIQEIFSVFAQRLVSLSVDMSSKFAIHFDLLEGTGSMSLLNIIQIFLFNIRKFGCKLHRSAYLCYCQLHSSWHRCLNGLKHQQQL